MKRFWQEVGIAVLLGMVIPGVVLRIAVWSAEPPAQEPEVTESVTEPVKSEKKIPVLTESGEITQMVLDEYLTGVVLAEMPAAFEEEALKAQVVVARTYAIRAHLGESKHQDAAVCTDSICCQAYRSPENYLLSGGTQENLEKVSGAVQGTRGLVLLYEDELIEATYFSCSGGSTEDAVAVWGTDVPYLKATPSPGEEKAVHHTDSVTLEREQLESALEIELSDKPSDWFGKVTYTSGGGVATVEIGGKEFSGTDIRKRLNLRSTAFTVEAKDRNVVIHTRGFGHRVGMSQYGADAMAAGGSNFEEILAHYYQGTVLDTLAD